MTNSQKIQLRQSEVRQRLNELRRAGGRRFYGGIIGPKLTSWRASIATWKRDSGRPPLRNFRRSPRWTEKGRKVLRSVS